VQQTLSPGERKVKLQTSDRRGEGRSQLKHFVPERFLETRPAPLGSPGGRRERRTLVVTRTKLGPFERTRLKITTDNSEP